MTQTIELTAPILPGKRLELTAPELPDANGDQQQATPPQSCRFASALEYLDSLTPVERTPEEWERIEREFREDRGSWDR